MSISIKVTCTYTPPEQKCRISLRRIECSTVAGIMSADERLKRGREVMRETEKGSHTEDRVWVNATVLVVQ